MSNVTTSPESTLKTYSHAIYAIQAISLVTAIPLVAAVIMNYIKLDQVQGTWLATHFRWQIRTFWFFMVWSITAGITTVIGIGPLVFAIAWCWLVYRIIRGWLALSAARPMVT